MGVYRDLTKERALYKNHYKRVFRRDLCLLRVRDSWTLHKVFRGHVTKSFVSHTVKSTNRTSELHLASLFREVQGVQETKDFATGLDLTI